MLKLFRLKNRCLRKCYGYFIINRWNSDVASDLQCKIRNIGILAHIDAGKTTTTERMLYFSGKIKSMGEVHKGNTVTDFMEQERNRGITIASAFVMFKWKSNTINLVDTPGHIDFTAEVEQALNVLDSAVIVLDGTAGVEVQTVTVWKQASQKSLPCLVYVNKMDRPESNLELCERSLREKLLIKPLLCHLPIKDGGKFERIIDLVKMKDLRWPNNSFSSRLLEKQDPYYDLALKRRNELTDVLSTLDDQLADLILECGSLEAVTPTQLTESIRRVTISQSGVPVVCGSSYKNIGVETLLDAITDFLPSPLDQLPYNFNKDFGSDFFAKAFKVMHDKRRGPMVFLRIYNGAIKKGQKVYNVNQEKLEQAGHVFMAFADDFCEVSSIGSGNFAAVTGLKETRPGEVICASATSAKKIMRKMTGSKSLEKLIQTSVIPKPVFFCSIEPPSQAYQLSLERALAELSQEDPSLSVSYNEETGQTVLSGMGELHLEVIKERIKADYKIDAEMGPVQIVYKEKLLSEKKETHCLQSHIGSSDQNVTLTMSLVVGEHTDILQLDMSKEASQNLSVLNPKQIAALKRGVQAALRKGPLLSCEVVNTYAVLHWIEAKRRTPEPLLTAAASQCVTKVLALSGTQLLEPIMSLNIAIDAKYHNSVIRDLARRRANVTSISSIDSLSKEIMCEVPLSELLGYAKILRTLTSGNAKLTMEFSSYQEMPPRIQEQLLADTI